ncbi:MAG: hypothetical protein ACRDUX_37815 [Mycobacterium sp.]
MGELDGKVAIYASTPSPAAALSAATVQRMVDDLEALEFDRPYTLSRDGTSAGQAVISTISTKPRSGRGCSRTTFLSRLRGMARKAVPMSGRVLRLARWIGLDRSIPNTPLFSGRGTPEAGL